MSYENVVFLSRFGQMSSKKKKQILYLSNQEESLSLLQSFHGIAVESTSSIQALNIQLFSWKRWDLVLIESNIEWTDPKETVALINEKLQIPVTLIDRHSNEEESLFRLKAFYEAGLHDCIKAPLCPKELAEVFKTLIR